MKKIIAPRYIQKSIRIMQKKAKIVSDWMTENNIDRKIPLKDFLSKEEPKKSKNSVIKGQMTIFDLITEKERGISNECKKIEKLHI